MYRINTDKCHGCGRCAQICYQDGNDAIEVRRYAKIDTDICSECGECTKVCEAIEWI